MAGWSGLIARAERYPKTAAFAVFALVTAIYLVNFDPVWSGDLNSNTVFAFNVLEFRTIYLDAFVESHLYKSFSSFTFVKAQPSSLAAGHYTLSYPVGTAIVTFPLYVVFYAYLKLFAPAVSFLSAEFEPYRLAFSHIAAAVMSAGTVMLFFLICRRRFPVQAAVVTTFCLAFATMQWGLLSQSLYQHNPSSFVTMAAAYLLLRADDSRGSRVAWLLLAAGALTGLLLSVRLTNLVFVAALLVFAALRFHRTSLLFGAGFAVTALLSIGWNWFFFGSLIGPAIFYGHTYNFAFATVVAGLLGLTVSPIRGLIPNSPFLLFTFPGILLVSRKVFRAVAQWNFGGLPAADLLFAMLLGASAVLFVSYAFSPFWGGGTYGSRYLSETMPVIAYFLNFLPFLQSRRPDTPRYRTTIAVFAGLVAVGIFHQVTAVVGGHTGNARWVSLPISELDLEEDRRWAYMFEAPFKSFQTRLWSIRDGLSERIWRGVYYNNYLKPLTAENAGRYGAGCNASVVSIQDGEGSSFDGTRVKRALSPFAPEIIENPSPHHWDAIFNNGRKFVRAKVRNDGTVPLYGYRTGLIWGFSAMTHKVIDEEGKTLYENGTVYVVEVIHPGETGDAIGSMEFPTPKGRYRVEGRMAVNGIGYCGAPTALGTIEVE